MKKVVILTGSPVKKGTTDALVEHFAYGAQATGTKVERFDTAFMHITPCDGVRECKVEDDMTKITKSLVEADVLVFATPIYYFTMSGQLKIAIDRFFNLGETMKGKKKVYVLAAGGGPAEAMVGLTVTMDGIIKYMGWEKAGEVLAGNCPDPGALAKTEYCMQAYNMGQKVGM